VRINRSSLTCMKNTTLLNESDFSYLRAILRNCLMSVMFFGILIYSVLSEMASIKVWWREKCGKGPKSSLWDAAKIGADQKFLDLKIPFSNRISHIAHVEYTLPTQLLSSVVTRTGCVASRLRRRAVLPA